MITQTAPTTKNLIRDDELLLHAEDDIKVNAIRNGKLVEVYWSQLTEDEQRAQGVTSSTTPIITK